MCQSDDHHEINSSISSSRQMSNIPNNIAAYRHPGYSGDTVSGNNIAEAVRISATVTGDSDDDSSMHSDEDEYNTVSDSIMHGYNLIFAQCTIYLLICIENIDHNLKTV